MSAPLQFEAPLGCGPANMPPTPSIGWRLEGVLATAVRPGHFTTFNGYRRVMSVAEGWVTEGRGKKRRTCLSKISFERADGTVDIVPHGAELTIYAPDVA